MYKNVMYILQIHEIRMENMHEGSAANQMMKTCPGYNRLKMNMPEYIRFVLYTIMKSRCKLHIAYFYINMLF